MSTAIATSVDYRPDADEMRAYLAEGERKARALDNRGPIRFIGDGVLHPDIVEAYWKYGFYVFTGVIDAEELSDLAADIEDIKSRLPVEKGAAIDAQGRPALAHDCKGVSLFWSKPLGDPFGGTQEANSRHPVKLVELEAPRDAPKEIVYLMLGTLQHSPAQLRLSGHPDLLGVAAAINGQDFVPFTEGIFLKEPGRGAAVAWHRDGVTHWDSPSWDQGTHGFNFMAQLNGCTPANGVWVLPGTHKQRRVDLPGLIAEAGTERIPGAIPMVCDPGDVVISNRQVLHGSFANTSPDWRVTFNIGFHRRASVLDVSGGGIHNAAAVYDEARIRERSRVIGIAIAARQKRFPGETPFVYRPHAEAGETFIHDDAVQASLHDYNLQDLSI